MIAAGKARTSKSRVAQRLADGITVASRHLRNVKLPDGMTRERLVTLATIDKLEPLSVGEVAAILQVRVPTISRMISSLADDGLVKRKKSKDDGRGVTVSLTAKGRRVYQDSNRQSLKCLSEAVGHLTDSQIAALSALAEKLEALEHESDRQGKV